jgi:predicted glycosyltransferase
MQKRLQILLEAIDQFRPHAIVIEHFPFRRWELFSEIVPLIQQAREIDRGVKIVCSLRDIPGRSRLDSSTEEHDRDVLNVLHGYFDQILIHADPRVIRLNEQTALAGIIDLPMEYTGYVSQRRDARQHDKFGAHAKRKSGDVIVSVAGTGHMALLSRTIDSWNNLISQQAVGDLARPLRRGTRPSRMRGRR